MNRNGLSAIVATIMIILLTVSAAGIIMGFVVPFVRDGLQESTECVAFQEYYKFNEDVGLESGTNCYLSNNELLISVSAQNLRESTSEVEGFNLVLFQEGSSKVILVKDGSSSDPKLKDLDGNVIEVPGPGETLTYKHDKEASNEFRFAELTPVLENGKICERRSDRISIRQCS